MVLSSTTSRNLRKIKKIENIVSFFFLFFFSHVLRVSEYKFMPTLNAGEVSRTSREDC